MHPTRVLIHGASGRMGSALLRLAAADDALQVVAAVSRSARPVGDDARWFDIARPQDIPAFDLVIDFSLPDALPALLELCRDRAAALVSGTTGLSASDQNRLETLAAHVAVLWASNFSLGVAVLGALARRAAASLPSWDIDIVELHHAGKRDAPSGTALTLGDGVRACGGRPPRFHSLRAGDVVGEHSVQLTGSGERLELIHRATHRDVFAQGALFAARWLAPQPAGRYQLQDALGTVLGEA